jgi:cell division transport system ATP-binding protein
VPQIEFKNIVKEYEGGFKALNDTSFAINQGEFVFLVGHSGAGKSTIIKLLVREEDPNSGQIMFNGEDISAISHDDVSSLRRKIGIVFQDFRLLNSKTIYDNVAIALEVTDTPQKEIKTIVPNVLSMVGMEDKVTNFPQTLSGGEKQKLSIARALAHEPDVLIADEPTGNIDPDSTQEIISILEKINKLGTTVIMATHDERIVDKLKKRVIRVEKGKIVSDQEGGKYRE